MGDDAFRCSCASNLVADAVLGLQRRCPGSRAREPIVPQGRVTFLITGAPKRPVTPKPRLRLAYSGPPLVRTSADVLAIIRARCADILTDAEIAMVIRLPAIEGPPQPKTIAADRQMAAKTPPNGGRSSATGSKKTKRAAKRRAPARKAASSPV
jgi:hypothetical protein